MRGGVSGRGWDEFQMNKIKSFWFLESHSSSLIATESDENIFYKNIHVDLIFRFCRYPIESPTLPFTGSNDVFVKKNFLIPFFLGKQNYINPQI